MHESYLNNFKSDVSQRTLTSSEMHQLKIKFQNVSALLLWKKKYQKNRKIFYAFLKIKIYDSSFVKIIEIRVIT